MIFPTHPVLISGILFALGLSIFCIRRSFYASLLSIMFIWAGAIMNLAVQSHEGVGGTMGQGGAVLLAVLAGLEVGVAFAVCRRPKSSASDTSGSCD